MSGLDALPTGKPDPFRPLRDAFASGADALPHITANEALLLFAIAALAPDAGPTSIDGPTPAQILAFIHDHITPDFSQGSVHNALERMHAPDKAYITSFTLRHDLQRDHAPQWPRRWRLAAPAGTTMLTLTRTWLAAGSDDPNTPFRQLRDVFNAQADALPHLTANEALLLFAIAALAPDASPTSIDGPTPEKILAFIREHITPDFNEGSMLTTLERMQAPGKAYITSFALLRDPERKRGRGRPRHWRLTDPVGTTVLALTKTWLASR